MKSEVSITTMSSENRAGVANNAIHLSRHRRFLSLSVTQCGQVMASVRLFQYLRSRNDLSEVNRLLCKFPEDFRSVYCWQGVEKWRPRFMDQTS